MTAENSPDGLFPCDGAYAIRKGLTVLSQTSRSDSWRLSLEGLILHRTGRYGHPG